MADLKSENKVAFDKNLIFQVLYLVIIFILAFIVVKEGVTRVRKQAADLKEARKIESTLSEKLNILKDSEANIKDNIDYLTLALPEKNPILILTSQINILLGEKGLLKEKITVGGLTYVETGLAPVELTVELSGSYSQFLSFIDSLQGIAPVVNITASDFTGGKEAITAKITISSYSAFYPKELPKIDDPIARLTEDDLAIIENVKSLRPLTMGSYSASPPSTRANPFQ